MADTTGDEQIENRYVATDDGSFAYLMYNRTGAPTVKGTTVKLDKRTSYGVVLTAARNDPFFGIVDADGIPTNGLVRVVAFGMTEVLVVAKTTARSGAAVVLSDIAGRAAIAKPLYDKTAYKNIGTCLEASHADTESKVSLMLGKS